MSGKVFGRLLKEKTLFFNCDIQSGFIKHIFKGDHIVNTARQMVQTANVLNIPILVTEQNIKAFGQTVPELSSDFPLHLTHICEKFTFSMLNEQTEAFLQTHKEKTSVVIFGIEAHVCIQQTCLDLLERGYQVHLLADGISSINQIDKQAAFQRLGNAGAFITTFQSIVFELLKTHNDPNFKKMLPILKLKTTEDRLQSL